MADHATTDLSNAPFTWRTLNMIAHTELVPRRLRGDPPAMYASIMLGRELGLRPMQSMNMIDVVNGRATLSAELQVAMIRETGHSIRLEELNANAATVTGTRHDNGDSISFTFTMEMAERAGLAGKRNWQQYPEAMLWARAVSMLARMLFADVFAAIHTCIPDELGSEKNPPTISTSLADLPARAPRGSDTVLSLEDALFGAIAVDIRASPTISDIETALDTMCSCAEELQLVHAPLGAPSWLNGQLANHGADSVKDLHRSELENFTLSVRADICEAFSRYNDARARVDTDRGGRTGS